MEDYLRKIGGDTDNINYYQFCVLLDAGTSGNPSRVSSYLSANRGSSFMRYSYFHSNMDKLLMHWTVSLFNLMFHSAVALFHDSYNINDISWWKYHHMNQYCSQKRRYALSIALLSSKIYIKCLITTIILQRHLCLPINSGDN